MLKHPVVSPLILSAALGAVSCQAPLLSPQARQDNSPAIQEFADLEAEYAPFTTQALTQNYLHRKLRQWVSSQNGHAVKRELLFGEYKHPTTLVQTLNTPTLCANVLGFPEVAQERSINPNLESLLQDTSCGNADYIGEFQVNTTTAGSQENPKSAMASDGSFVMVWQSPQDSDNSVGIYGQRFNPDGSKNGGEFQVHSNSANEQSQPEIAMDSNGHFIVVWKSNHDLGGDQYGIYFQRFLSDGTPIGGEATVSSPDTGNGQVNLDIADDGSFAVVYKDAVRGGGGAGLFVHRFLADGTPVGDPLSFAENQSNNHPQVSFIPGGHDFFVAWHHEATEAQPTGIYLRQFSSSTGEFSPEEQRAHSAQRTPAGIPAIQAILYSGRPSLLSTYTDQSLSGYSTIYLSHYATGRFYEQRVSERATGNAFAPQLALGTGNALLLSWSSQREAAPDVYARFYAPPSRENPEGLPLNTAFAVNTYFEQSQSTPTLSASGSQFVIGWQSAEQDGSGLGLYAQSLSFTLGENNNQPTWE